MHTHAWHMTTVLYSPGFLLMLISFLNTTYDYIMRNTHNFALSRTSRNVVIQHVRPRRIYVYTTHPICIWPRGVEKSGRDKPRPKEKWSSQRKRKAWKCRVTSDAQPRSHLRRSSMTFSMRNRDTRKARLSKCMIDDDDSIMIIIP